MYRLVRYYNDLAQALQRELCEDSAKTHLRFACLIMLERVLVQFLNANGLAVHRFSNFSVDDLPKARQHDNSALRRMRELLGREQTWIRDLQAFLQSTDYERRDWSSVSERTGSVSKAASDVNLIATSLDQPGLITRHWTEINVRDLQEFIDGISALIDDAEQFTREE